MLDNARKFDSAVHSEPTPRKMREKWGGRVMMILVITIMMGAFTFAAFAQAAATNVQILGPEDGSKQMSVTYWLKQHDKAAFDELVRQMYDKSSANYHHWLTLDEYKARFAPTAGDMATVKQHLAANNLKVVAADPLNHFVTAQGAVADVQRATGVQMNQVMIKGEVHRMPASDIVLGGAAGKVVAAVQASDLAYQTNVAPARNFATGKAYAGVPLTSGVAPAGKFFSANCWRAEETHTFKTSGGGPTAVYSGNRYGSNISSAPPNLPSCGYDAVEIQRAYGLNDAYAKDWNGRGQTIVIVDGFGSNTITADANTFSELNGLPLLTNKNFAIYKPNGKAFCGNDCVDGNWEIETSIDVEWAHALAPQASIALVLGADNTFTNLDIANLYAVESLLGNVISNSFGIQEILLIDYFPSELVVESSLAETAAALGISLDLSSGDDGDFLAVDKEDYGIDSVSVESGASSPYATAVGATSTFLNGNASIKLQTGWGLNYTQIAGTAPSAPVVPPAVYGFYFGSGGGTSAYFAKPAYQSSLPGNFRMLPDVSMNGDPETGSEIIVTPSQTAGGAQYVEVWGGTSLSCPQFSALWAIANQVAGVPLGQAAPYLYSLDSNAITDVTDVTSPYNVAGTIYNPPSPPEYESPDMLAGPLENTVNYLSAFFQSQDTSWLVFTFGTDSSLTTGPGWDNVTGVGTPNAEPFIEEVVAEAAAQK